MLQHNKFLFFPLTFLVASLGIALSIAPVHAQPAPMIFGGVGIGKIRLGESRASVLQKLGPPTKSLFWDTMALRQDTWMGKQSKSRLVVLYLKGIDRVVQIETTSQKFTTPEGLSLQTPLSDIKAWAGKATQLLFLKSNRPKNPDHYWLVFDSPKGIAFFVKTTDDAREMKSWKSEKIIVFPAGNAGPAYSRSAYTRDAGLQP